MQRIDLALVSEPFLAALVAEICTYASRPDLSRHLDRLGEYKARYVQQQDETGAKSIWVLENLCTIHQNFVRAFDLLQEQSAMEAFRLLERIDVKCTHVRPHLERSDEYGLDLVKKATENWISMLYPFTGFSMGGKVHRASCSTCGERIGLRPTCAHKVGEIYAGEQCARRIERIELVEISIVDRPAYLIIENHKDKIDARSSMFAEIASRLERPYRMWNVRRVHRRTEHPRYQVGRNDTCPCGSGSKFKRCCLNKENVDDPHWAIEV